jgi:excisionase family DNA binding protein
MSSEPFVEIEAAAAFLGVKVSWLYEQVRLERLPSHKVGKFRRFRLSELEHWVTGNGKGDLLRTPQKAEANHV